MSMLIPIAALVISLISLLYAFYIGVNILKKPEGSEKMLEIASAIKQGASAFIRKEYRIIIIFIIIVAVLLGALRGISMAVSFILGGIFSMLAGYFGMKIAVNSNSRTAYALKKNLNDGLRIAFSSGSVMGLSVVGLGLFGVTLLYLIFNEPSIIFGFGFGASSIALFARVGGGIYTKAADVGADLVGKVEAGIPEDDPRNPATIADNVGDNVGDVAGMGADLYESYCGSILATAAIGASIAAHNSYIDPTFDMQKGVMYVAAPMIVAGLGIFMSILGMFLVKCKEDATQKNLLNALLTGTLGSSVFILFAIAVLAKMGVVTWGIFGSVSAGLLAGVLIGQSTEYYTSGHYKPTQSLAGEAKMGAATVIIDGLANGMYSAGIPVITIVIGILCSFGFAGGFSDFSMGLYGIGFAAVGMLSTLGITLATDAYGPIADNAGGNAEMSGLEPEVRERTDALDALGNTTAATGKGFAIGSAALTAMALMAAYIEEGKIWAGNYAGTGTFLVGAQEFTKDAVSRLGILDFVELYKAHLMNPLLLCGMFLGAMAAFVFCAMTMKAVGRAAGAMVNEVRRQFKETPGIMDGMQKADYARCVMISTVGAQKEMILPSLLAIFIPVATGLVFGVAGVIGLLAGGLSTGFVLATMLNNAGGAWDNAKKYIESGHHGGKKLPDGSKNPVHAAAVIGDTVGDPCKDTSGPSLNILIKLMSMVSIVFAPVIVKFSPIIQGWLGIMIK